MLVPAQKYRGTFDERNTRLGSSILIEMRKFMQRSTALAVRGNGVTAVPILRD